MRVRRLKQLVARCLQSQAKGSQKIKKVQPDQKRPLNLKKVSRKNKIVTVAMMVSENGTKGV